MIMFQVYADMVCLFFITFIILSCRIEGFNGNITDRQALLAFKNSIVHDPQNALSSWNDSLHFCQWESVTCGRRHQRITRIDFTSRALSGPLSPYIANLSFLQILQINNNSLYGEIPPQLGNLLRLKVLNLFLNTLTGEIPANISRCSNLQHFRVGRNNLVGKLPEELGALSKLKSFVIEENSFTGKLPPFLGNFTLLEILYARRNLLSGNIPDSIGDLKQLSILGLATNNLSGTIPPSVYNLSSLTQLSLDSNQFQGDLQPNIGWMLPHLHIFQISENRFTGLLPSSLSNCSELEVLQTDSNSFRGKIALDFGGQKSIRSILFDDNHFGTGETDEMNFISSLSNCSNLESLSASSNKLRGKIPDSVGNMSTKLRFLNFEVNQIYGRLPSAIGNLVNLDTFGLDDNQLTGTIPSSIGNLGKLQVAAFSQNQFTGAIPNSIGNLTLLIKLYMNMNKLEGIIPMSLANCTNLLLLELSQNKLSGLIPKQLFRLSTLSIALNLSHNSLQGSVPFDIGNLVHLGSLDLSNNDLSGKIPSALGSCTSLENLLIQKNLFQGTIPSSFSSLKGVSNLDVSNNNLSGQIPRFLEMLSIKYLNLSFNNFEGEVPSKGVFANKSIVSVAGNKNLCGGMSELHLQKCPDKGSGKKPRKYRALVILFSIIGVVVCAAILIWFLYKHKKLRKVRSINRMATGSFLQVSYGDLFKATDGFSSENVVGSGSFGSVYKGILNVNKMVVAVKVLNLHSYKSFMNECEAMRNVRHRNLLKIITTCSSIDSHGNEFRALVYEFMPNGSLEQWLHPTVEAQNEQAEQRNLTLLRIINIAIDVAYALDYLHHQCEQPIIHCDVKPSNILLDNDMVAKVGDFGLAKFLHSQTTDSTQSNSAGLRGTIGYAAPEYGLGSEISTYGDVYSFGIFLLEMITGKKPTDCMFNEGLNLHKFVSISLPDHVKDVVNPSMFLDDNVENIEKFNKSGSDAVIRAKVIEECLVSVLRIGVACSVESPQARMSIRDVVRELSDVRDIISRTKVQVGDIRDNITLT